MAHWSPLEPRDFFADDAVDTQSDSVRSTKYVTPIQERLLFFSGASLETASATRAQGPGQARPGPKR